MLDEHKTDSGRSSFRMELTVKRTVEIRWNKLEKDLLNHSEKEILIFIDPIVLSDNSGLLSLENEIDDISIIPINLFESEKTESSLLEILSVMEQQGVSRRGHRIYAIGGGVLLDVVSLATSIFRRGVDVVKVPTTLLAFVDASIGIKTGINFQGQRNRIGSYNLRFDVLLDESLLASLDPQLISEGLGEIFKIATIKCKTLFGLLEDKVEELLNPKFYTSASGCEILSKAINLMLEELCDNPEEINLKRCVDFGHTFSPFVEMESVNSSRYRSLPHGYAVAYDCILTSMIALKRGLLGEADFDRLYALFSSVNFDPINDIYNDNELLWASLVEMTKHRGGNQNIPYPVEIGKHAFLQDVSFDEMKKANAQLRDLLKV